MLLIEHRTIKLRVTNGRNLEYNSRTPRQSLPKIFHKSEVAIRDYTAWKAMLRQHLKEKDICAINIKVDLSRSSKVCRPGKAKVKSCDAIGAFGFSQYVRNKIHTYGVLPLGLEC